jgi:hypothetical protein
VRASGSRLHYREGRLWSAFENDPPAAASGVGSVGLRVGFGVDAYTHTHTHTHACTHYCSPHGIGIGTLVTCEGGRGLGPATYMNIAAPLAL